MGMGNKFGSGETGRRCFHLAGMRVTTISQEETGCGQADCSIMQGTCKLHGPASHYALAFLLDAALPSAGGNSPKYAKSMLFEGTKMLGALTLSFFHRSRYTGKTDLWRRAPLLGLGRKSRRTHSLKGVCMRCTFGSNEGNLTRTIRLGRPTAAEVTHRV